MRRRSWPGPGHVAAWFAELCAQVVAIAMPGRSDGRPRPEERTRADGERGDVPGCVLITLMTAGSVAMLWVLAREQFATPFTQAMDVVTGMP